MTLERAAEAKAPERAAIGELLVLLVQRGAVTAADLRFALHEYLEFLDADDLLAPDKIARQVARLADGRIDRNACRSVDLLNLTTH